MSIRIDFELTVASFIVSVEFFLSIFCISEFTKSLEIVCGVVGFFFLMLAVYPILKIVKGGQRNDKR